MIEKYRRPEDIQGTIDEYAKALTIGAYDYARNIFDANPLLRGRLTNIYKSHAQLIHARYQGHKLGGLTNGQ